MLGLLGTFLEPGGWVGIGNDAPYIYTSKSAPLPGSVRQWALTFMGEVWRSDICREVIRHQPFILGKPSERRRKIIPPMASLSMEVVGTALLFNCLCLFIVLQFPSQVQWPWSLSWWVTAVHRIGLVLNKQPGSYVYVLINFALTTKALQFNNVFLVVFEIYIIYNPRLWLKMQIFLVLMLFNLFSKSFFSSL